MSTLYLKIPALGESITEAMIGKWKRAEGEAVKADEPLVEVESDKATVEVPVARRRRAPQDPAPGRARPCAIGEVIAEIEEGATAPAAGPGNGRGDRPPAGAAAAAAAAADRRSRAPPRPRPPRRRRATRRRHAGQRPRRRRAAG